MMIQLGMNIDHIATLRQARRTYETDPVWAAVEAQLAGADAITMHLREDRRHIQDDDVQRVRQTCHIRVNLEMAATAEMVKIATQLKPHMATLVPEGRLEVTTEGGLEVAAQLMTLKDVVGQLHDAGVAVSAFVDAQASQIDAAAVAGFDFCEIHTGPYAAAFHQTGGLRSGWEAQLEQIAEAGRRIVEAGMGFNAGHALNYVNITPIAALPALRELHIGHSIVSRAVFVGLRQAIIEMKALLK